MAAVGLLITPSRDSPLSVSLLFAALNLIDDSAYEPTL
jgi:hypothetical protein